MLKRVVLSLVFIALGALLIRELVHRFSSDETKIIRALGNLVEAFNDESTSDVLSYLTIDWEDGTRRVNRDEIRRGLAYLYLQPGFRHEGELSVRCRVDEESLEVTVEGDRGDVEVDLIFDRLGSEGWKESWKITATLEYRRVDGDWLLAHSAHETLGGKRPF